MSHVFRDGEIGLLHNPEFTMVEWYRLGLSFDELIKETVQFIRLFLGPIPSSQLSYRETVQKYAQIDYLSATAEELIQCAKNHQLSLPDNYSSWDKDSCLHFLMGFVVEPNLGASQLKVIRDYPASQAALAATGWNGDEPVAKRFEVYYKGIELANGFQELTDPLEQRKRFELANQQRIEMGKAALPIDRQFLAALEAGLPACCGVAVGFDRLMLLRHAKPSIADVLPIAWSEA
jgi:elongation factor P--(R)-beta-lysine ligase